MKKLISLILAACTIVPLLAAAGFRGSDPCVRATALATAKPKFTLGTAC